MFCVDVCLLKDQLDVSRMEKLFLLSAVLTESFKLNLYIVSFIDSSNVDVVFIFFRDPLVGGNFLVKCTVLYFF